MRSMGNQFGMTFFVTVGRLDAQFIELQELRGVRGAVVVRRQIRLELAWSNDGAQLGSEGAIACSGHRGPLQGRSLPLMSVHCCQRRHAVLSWWCQERFSIFLRPRDLLEASFFMRGHTAWRITPYDHASWGEDTVLTRRRRWCSVSVLVQGCRLDPEATKALHELRRPRLEVGEAARGMVHESPQRR